MPSSSAGLCATTSRSSTVRRTSTSSQSTPCCTAARNDSRVFSRSPSTVPRPQPRWPRIADEGPKTRSEPFGKTLLPFIMRSHGLVPHLPGSLPGAGSRGGREGPAHLRVRTLEVIGEVHFNDEAIRDVQRLNTKPALHDRGFHAAFEEVLVGAALEVLD